MRPAGFAGGDYRSGAPSSAQPTAGTGYELDAIAAVVLGGTSLAGKGRIVGTFDWRVDPGFRNNGLNLLGRFFPLPDDRESGGNFAGGAGRQQKQ